MYKRPRLFFAQSILAAALVSQNAFAYGAVWEYGGKFVSAAGIKTGADSRGTAARRGLLDCQAERRSNGHSRRLSCRTETFANRCAAVYAVSVVGGGEDYKTHDLVVLRAYGGEGDWTDEGRAAARKNLIKKCAELEVPPSAKKNCPDISKIFVQCDMTPDCPGFSYGKGNRRCEKELWLSGELTEGEKAAEEAVGKAQARALDAAVGLAAAKVASGSSSSAAAAAAKTAAESAMDAVAAESSGAAKQRISEERGGFAELAGEAAVKTAESAKKALRSARTREAVQASMLEAARKETGWVRNAMVSAAALVAGTSGLPASLIEKALTFESELSFERDDGEEDYTYTSRADYRKGSFSAFITHESSRDDESYSYGTRWDVGGEEINAYWELNQSQYNGVTDAISYLMGVEYEKEFVSAEVDGTSYEGVLTMDVEVSGDWEKGIWRYGSGVNYEWTNEYGEDASAYWDTNVVVSYKKWEINPAVNVYWESDQSSIGENVEIELNFTREF